MARPSIEAPRTLKALLEGWQGRVSGPQARILAYLWERRGRSVPRAEIARMTGASRTSSSFSNNLSALRSLGLIDYPNGTTATVTDLLFPNGLK